MIEKISDSTLRTKLLAESLDHNYVPSRSVVAAISLVVVLYLSSTTVPQMSVARVGIAALVIGILLAWGTLVWKQRRQAEEWRTSYAHTEELIRHINESPSIRWKVR